MTYSEAKVPTEDAASYLRKLCQHWSHRFQVNVEDTHGTIDLPLTHCVLDAFPAALRVRLAFEESADPERMKTVVEEHLQRFGFKETLQFVWADSVEPPL